MNRIGEFFRNLPYLGGALIVLGTPLFTHLVFNLQHKQWLSPGAMVAIVGFSLLMGQEWANATIYGEMRYTYKIEEKTAENLAKTIRLRIESGYLIGAILTVIGVIACTSGSGD